jgi:heme/copper-type cytochrome/quinol oxidase subunit 1
MRKIFEKPHLIFLILTPMLFLIGYFSPKNTFDINIYDTYYVVEHGLVPIAISLFFGIIGFGYWLIFKFKGKLSKLLTIVHILLTIGGLIVIRILLELYREPKAESFLFDYNFNENLNMTMFIISIIILFGQIIYPINLVVGLIKRNK